MGSPGVDSAAVARARLVAAVERCRADQSSASSLAREFCSMTTDDAVSRIEVLLREASRRHASGSEALKALDAAALALEAVHLRRDAALLRLTASSALEGWELGETMRELKFIATMIVSATDQEVECQCDKAEPVGSLLSLAFDGEGDVFARAFASGIRPHLASITRAWRESLLEDGIVMPVGFCTGCKREVRLIAGGSCPVCGRSVRNVSYAVSAQ